MGGGHGATVPLSAKLIQNLKQLPLCRNLLFSFVNSWQRPWPESVRLRLLFTS